MSEEPLNNSSNEIDRLKYRGNSVPFFIKFVWVAITIYTIAYMAIYSWPDLMIWIKK